MNWYGIPKELEPELKEFMELHGLAFSSGYIGMLRCYRKNLTVWQTSSIAPIRAANEGRNIMDSLPTDEQLASAGREFLRAAMAMPPDELERRFEEHVPLFSDADMGELYKMKADASKG